MTIKVGDSIPSVTIMQATAEGPKEVDTAALLHLQQWFGRLRAEGLAHDARAVGEGGLVATLADFSGLKIILNCEISTSGRECFGGHNDLKVTKENRATFTGKPPQSFKLVQRVMRIPKRQTQWLKHLEISPA